MNRSRAYKWSSITYSSRTRTFVNCLQTCVNLNICEPSITNVFVSKSANVFTNRLANNILEFFVHTIVLKKTLIEFKLKLKLHIIELYSFVSMTRTPAWITHIIKSQFFFSRVQAKKQKKKLKLCSENSKWGELRSKNVRLVDTTIDVVFFRK